MTRAAILRVGFTERSWVSFAPIEKLLPECSRPEQDKRAKPAEARLELLSQDLKQWLQF
jgi:hypothetical protein